MSNPREIHTNEIYVQFIPPKHWWQRAKWKLLKPYVSQNGEVHVEAGFITDGATIIWALRWLFSPTGAYFGAAIIHDYIIVNENDWRKANEQFEHEMDNLGIRSWVRRTMVGAVKFWARIKGK